MSNRPRIYDVVTSSGGELHVYKGGKAISSDSDYWQDSRLSFDKVRTCSFSQLVFFSRQNLDMLNNLLGPNWADIFSIDCVVDL